MAEPPEKAIYDRDDHATYVLNLLLEPGGPFLHEDLLDEIKEDGPESATVHSAEGEFGDGFGRTERDGKRE